MDPTANGGSSRGGQPGRADTIATAEMLRPLSMTPGQQQQHLREGLERASAGDWANFVGRAPDASFGASLQQPAGSPHQFGLFMDVAAEAKQRAVQDAGLKM
jgi:hypothetical protein